MACDGGKASMTMGRASGDVGEASERGEEEAAEEALEKTPDSMG